MRLVELARVIEAQRNLVGIEVELAKQSRNLPRHRHHEDGNVRGDDVKQFIHIIHKGRNFT